MFVGVRRVMWFLSGMRDITEDTRFALFFLCAEGVWATGAALIRVLRLVSKDERLTRKLRALESAGLITAAPAARLDERVFRLTAAGRARLFGPIDPEAQWTRSWSGRWTIVAFDIPETAIALRARFRRQLRLLRFGWLQNSVWISPDSPAVVTGLAGTQGISPDSLTIFEGRTSGGETLADVVAAAWDFARIDREYAGHRRILEARPASTDRDTARWKKWADAELRAWSRVAALDPFLPEALLPAGYAGRKAWQQRTRALTDLAAAIAPGATSLG
jgi:phenylacetic acid degradation operon negative regulatory protein